jgi:hypothetical protein
MFHKKNSTVSIEDSRDDIRSAEVDDFWVICNDYFRSTIAFSGNNESSRPLLRISDYGNTGKSSDNCLAHLFSQSKQALTIVRTVSAGSLGLKRT